MQQRLDQPKMGIASFRLAFADKEMSEEQGILELGIFNLQLVDDVAHQSSFARAYSSVDNK